MKRYIFRIMLLVSLITAPTLWSYAADPPEPPPPPSPGLGDPIGGGAPIGSGLFIMLAMGAAWAGKKTFDARKDIEK